MDEVIGYVVDISPLKTARNERTRLVITCIYTLFIVLLLFFDDLGQYKELQLTIKRQSSQSSACVKKGGGGKGEMR